MPPYRIELRKYITVVKTNMWFQINTLNKLLQYIIIVVQTKKKKNNRLKIKIIVLSISLKFRSNKELQSEQVFLE